MNEEYTLLGEPLHEDPDAIVGTGSIAGLEQYSYFDGERILNSYNLPAESRRAGEKMAAQSGIGTFTVTSGYEQYGRDGEMIGQISWHVKEKRREFDTIITFDRQSVKKARCECAKCMKKYGRYGWYYDSDSNCEYVAALLYVLRNYLSTHNIGDATDRDASILMAAYQQKRTNQLVASQTAKEESVTLKPRLVKKDGRLTATFKIGTGRLFVIKQLDEFCSNVRNAATALYGTSTEINHRRSNFTDESRRWLRFIERIVQEETEFGQRLEDATRSSYYYQKSARVGSMLNLFGWRLDELYNEMGDDAIEYEDRDASKTRKLLLHRGEGNPQIRVQISEALLDGGTDERYDSPAKGGMGELYDSLAELRKLLEDGPSENSSFSRKRRRVASHGASGSADNADREFQGIQVEGSLPELFFGMNHAYYVDGDVLRRSDPEFQEKIETLTSMTDEFGDFSFRVGRNRMSEFYYQVLPALQDVVQIIETDPDRIHAFLPPNVTYVFYLDAQDGDVMCSPVSCYEEKECSLLDVIEEDRNEPIERYRDISAEQEVLYQIAPWFPQADFMRRELRCGGDEDLIYQVMTDGVEKMMTLGEVRCTNRFRTRRRIRQVKVSVGVSVSSGLLDLDITTDDVPQDELLEILNSYRIKKNYYRLKDGSYVNLDDHSLELLVELMDSMHLKPKEFVKGRMHLPLYRTLYLNKMLEENDSVYSDRDSRFREMVKEFKTINDADFDVPQSLTGIMRQYQKDGYKWLRTLETWQFGGILADDMGLGKTLQMIAVLLAAKEAREASASPIQLPVDVSSKHARGAKSPKRANAAGNAGSTNAVSTVEIENAGAVSTAKTENTNAVSTSESTNVTSTWKSAGVPETAVSLVVAPASLVFNWGEEFARFAPALRILLVTGTQEERQRKIASCREYDVLVTSYDLLKRDIDLYEDLMFEYEVIDEAQYIKNHTTAAAKAVKVIKSRYRFALTGTPIENRLSELWSIFDYLMPGFLYAYDTFKREMETPIVKYQDEQAMKRLQKMTGPFILRRLKEDVLKDLPDKLEEVRYVRLGEEQQKLYDGQIVHMRETIASQDAAEFNKSKLVILTELMRLRQICCDPALCFDGYHGESAKADACMDLIHSAMDGGHRMLLFSQFTSMLEILKSRLDQEKIAYFVITGATPKQERLRLVKEFNSGSTPVFLISLKAGGVGLNLTGADMVIHYDPWWNVAAQNQATDRAHRIGQTKKVTVFKLIARHSIEEKILKLQQDKSDLADQIISGESSALGSMTKDELLDLLDGNV
ncbi:MAG: SNF2 helicase associated domain-containing protein [Lachnospiraceae bacterium]|nr:SNF2 helicase associated domain-containing protein [Lachnospiraceae bacterium]